MNIDERSASLWLLVLPRLIRTNRTRLYLWFGSGSLFTAILEAQYSGVPLIVLSADGPHVVTRRGSRKQ